jgi:hypothetical protein
MKEAEAHPVEGDTLVLTDIVHSRCIIGTGLPAGYKLANEDQTFDSYHVEVTNIEQFKTNGTVSREILTLTKPDGSTTKASYTGREPIAGTAGSSIQASNSQGAVQRYNWHKLE